MSVSPIIDSLRHCIEQIERVHDESSARLVLNEVGELIKIYDERGLGQTQESDALTNARTDIEKAITQARSTGWEDAWNRYGGNAYADLEHAEHIASKKEEKSGRTLN